MRVSDVYGPHSLYNDSALSTSYRMGLPYGTDGDTRRADILLHDEIADVRYLLCRDELVQLFEVAYLIFLWRDRYPILAIVHRFTRFRYRVTECVLCIDQAKYDLLVSIEYVLVLFNVILDRMLCVRVIVE